MKICHICSNYDKFFIDFMEQQIASNLDIRVFYFRAQERGFPEVEAPYLDVRLNYNNWQRYFFMYKEKQVLDDFIKLYDVEKINMLHAHTLYSNGFIAYKLKKLYNIPYIVAVRAMDVNVFLKYRLNLRKIGIDILKEAEKIVFISNNYKNEVILKYVPKKYHKSFLEKSLVIPNGINSFYLENTYQKNEMKSNEKLRFITVGYISKRKNQLTVCKAVEELNLQGIPTEYIVIGKILDKDIFDKLIEFPFVKYIPFMSKEDLISEYRKADIFVMPSKAETFGLTYVEAMSQGLPIIYSKKQGFDGYFEDGQVGYSVSSSSPQEIVEATKKIIENYFEISQKCSTNSTKFNWKDITNEYIEVYREILK